ENLTYQAERLDPKHPLRQGVRTFLAGSMADAADVVGGFTSPVGVATAAAGGAGKLPGAIGTVGKAITGLTGAGFAAKGASDILEAGWENTPDAWRQRLMGGAEVAGGAATVKESAPLATIKSTALLGRTPEAAYESAMKPSTTVPPA